LSKHQNEVINNTEDTLLDLLSQVNDKIKENAFDIIQTVDQAVKNNIELAITHAENATTVVINKTLEKIQNELEIIGQTIRTKNSLKFMSIYFLFKISNSLRRGAEGVKPIAKMLLFIALLLLPIDYILVFRWFLCEAIREMSLFYIGRFSIILSTIIPIVQYIYNSKKRLYKHICEQLNKRQKFRSNEHELLTLTTTQSLDKY
jgi:hypothetical protein